LLDGRFNRSRTNAKAFGLKIAIVDNTSTVLIEVVNELLNIVMLPVRELLDCGIYISSPK
jgi:hypothetical protein